MEGQKCSMQCGEGFVFVSTGKEKLWIPSTLKKSDLKEDPLKILAADRKIEINNKMGKIYADLSTWEQL